jgi:hypothetical protein
MLEVEAVENSMYVISLSVLTHCIESCKMAKDSSYHVESVAGKKKLNLGMFTTKFMFSEEQICSDTHVVVEINNIRNSVGL